MTRRELAATDAVSGLHHCQFAASAPKAKQLAATDAVSGLHHCQFAASAP